MPENSEQQGTQSTPPTPTAQQTPAPASGENYKQRLARQLESMVAARGGGIEGTRDAALKLMEDNQEQREKLRKMRLRVVDQGAEVLRGAELEAWKAYRALNLTAAQLKEKLDLVPVLQGKLKDLDNERFFDTVSDHMGFSPEGRKAFAKVAKMYGLEFEVRDVEIEKADGTKEMTKKPFAKIAGDEKGEFRALDVYLNTDLKEFKPSLYADAEDSDSPTVPVTRDSPTHAPERKVTPMPTQTTSTRTRDAEPPVRRAVNSTLDAIYNPRKAAGEKA